MGEKAEIICIEVEKGRNIPQNQHQILRAVKKKCFICGAEYPALDKREHCACFLGGYLYTIMQ